jgi:serine/threonine protein kinase
MAVSTVDDFLAMLERSKLLKAEEIAEARRLGQESSDATALAKNLIRQGKLSRWQAGQLLAGRSTFFLGKYKLIELLGKGGMGSVFLSEHVMMNRRAALKIIPRQVSKDPAGLERFLAEARTIAAVDHPNIVQAYNVDNEGDLYYLVMEYVDGLDLQRLVEAEGPLDCPSAVDYVRQAADGLAHAHARKMIHCDIKPSNLIVNPQGVVKILDMGLARLVGHEEVGGEATVEDERILGSVDYLAPEQALRAADFDHRADIYSLGCTLYFLLTGHAPFPEGTLTERILKHQTQQPPNIAGERSNVPQSLIEICKKMMAKRPADRYQTAAQVSQVLAAWRPGEQRVQRALTMKKAEPVDELPGPDLLGMDLSELFRKGMGTSTAAISTKPYEFTTKRASRSTTRQLIITAGISGLVAIVVIAAMIWYLIPSKTTTVVVGEGPPSAENKISIIAPPTNGNQPRISANNHPNADSSSIPSPQKQPSIPPPPPATAYNPMPIPKTELQPDLEASQPTIPQDYSQPGETQVDVTPVEQPKFEPFKDLAASIDLPEIPGAGKPGNAAESEVSLGLVHLPGNAPLRLKLIGGEKIFRGADSLVMQSDGSSQRPSLWRIYFEGNSPERGDPANRNEIGRLALDGEKLTFRWLPEATHIPADALRRCGVLAAVENEEQFVQFCRPRPAKPLLLDLERGVARVSLQSELMSEASNPRLQILEREGDFPPNDLQPSDLLEIVHDEKSKIYLEFLEKKYANLNVEISCELKGQNLEIEATVYYLIPGQSQQKLFRAKELLDLSNSVSRRLYMRQNEYDRLPDNAPRKAILAAQLQQQKNISDFLQELDGIYKALNKQGKIHYRVFIPYDQYRVELLNSHI